MLSKEQRKLNEYIENPKLFPKRKYDPEWVALVEICALDEHKFRAVLTM